MSSHITRKKMLKAIPNSGGILSTIAKRCGVTRQAVFHFVKRYPEYNSLIEHERETIVDMAEGSLFMQVKNQESWATKFLLATLGKQRGYIEKQEVEHSGDLNISHSMVDRFNESLTTARIEERKEKKETISLDTKKVKKVPNKKVKKGD